MKVKAIMLFILGAVFILGIPSYGGAGDTLVGIILAALCFSRQSILRAIKFCDGEFSNGVVHELKSYEWEGKTAYGIYANGQQIGNVPADKVAYITEIKDRIVDVSYIEVYGGGRDKEGHSKNFGCEVVIRLNK